MCTSAGLVRQPRCARECAVEARALVSPKPAKVAPTSSALRLLNVMYQAVARGRCALDAAAMNASVVLLPVPAPACTARSAPSR